jgi:hypothetical protein
VVSNGTSSTGTNGRRTPTGSCWTTSATHPARVAGQGRGEHLVAALERGERELPDAPVSMKPCRHTSGGPEPPRWAGVKLAYTPLTLAACEESRRHAAHDLDPALLRGLGVGEHRDRESEVAAAQLGRLVHQRA